MKWILLFVGVLTLLSHQNKPIEIAVIGFYNLENLYDTIDNPITSDDEFTPNGAKHYTSDIYINKLYKLAYVLKDFGKEWHPRGAAIIGVAEIENDTVLNDLANHFLLRNKKYQFIHFDSKDARGVDVGLFYQQDYFHPYTAKALEVILPGKSKEAYFTRDILYVKGKLSGEEVHIYVNHWPSRRGGEDRSAPARAAAAKLCKAHADSIRIVNNAAKIIVMGDLNDNPTDKSIIETLGATGNLKDLHDGIFFNPWIRFYERGIGTLANRDVWGLFDQILLSKPFFDSTNNDWRFLKAGIYHQPFMTENTGRYKGYPMRTWDGNHYRGGFSDHYPTYVVLKK
ncbi:endonuclease/exonuclease/phosphatase [Sediminibacterium sp.]|uniref:endonuclease/exonuclease/phosphatase family protein n=1 Tax=Sediminibacterium sp. TaxID=1917865 RepID=UPI003F6EF7E4